MDCDKTYVRVTLSDVLSASMTSCFDHFAFHCESSICIWYNNFVCFSYPSLFVYPLSFSQRIAMEWIRHKCYISRIHYKLHGSIDTLWCVSLTSSLPLKCIIYYYLCNKSIRPLLANANSDSHNHTAITHASVINLRKKQNRRRKKKIDWKCFISMACHYILFEKTKSEALGERWSQKREINKANKTCIERNSAYNVMLSRKFIFNRLCTRTDTIITIIII